MLFVFLKGMSSKPRGRGPIAVLTVFLLLIISTLVSLSEVSFTGFISSSDLSSLTPVHRTPQNRGSFKCTNNEIAEISMAEYFELRQALHFYESIQTAIISQPQARERLMSVSVLLNGINQELLREDHLRGRTRLNRWVESYPGSEKFKLPAQSSEVYDLPAFYEYVEQDVHRFFRGLLQETLLPQNFWEVKHYDNILSLGVRLGENTWARVGLYPNQWHLHIFKSAPQANLTTPKEHLPLQALSLRLVGPRQFEIVDGSGRAKMTLKSAEELELIPLCEWMSGEHRKEEQASQRVLKSL